MLQWGEKFNNLLKNQEWKCTCIKHISELWYDDSNFHKFRSQGLKSNDLVVYRLTYASIGEKLNNLLKNQEWKCI
jgi:hypothetical protein